MRWSLIPPGSREVPRYPLNNARADKLGSWPWKAARRQRCLIPASGFREPEKRAREKGAAPWSFYGMADGRPFWMAGLWSDAPDPATGEAADSCTLVVGEANAAMRVHDRMPATLPNAAARGWGQPALRRRSCRSPTRPRGCSLGGWATTPGAAGSGRTRAWPSRCLRGGTDAGERRGGRSRPRRSNDDGAVSTAREPTEARGCKSRQLPKSKVAGPGRGVQPPRPAARPPPDVPVRPGQQGIAWCGRDGPARPSQDEVGGLERDQRVEHDLQLGTRGRVVGVGLDDRVPVPLEEADLARARELRLADEPEGRVGGGQVEDHQLVGVDRRKVDPVALLRG